MNHQIRFVAIGLAILLLQLPALASEIHQHGVGGQKDCDHCHESENPTPGKAKLKLCTREDEPATPVHTASEAPDVFLLDQLSDIYVPVVFPHKLHAAMGEMGGGCDMCHHHHDGDRIPPCRECHGGPSNPVNLRQPGLKGAYHRQCLGCHREWTHATDCVVCHAKREPGVEVKLPKTPDDIMGMLHPNVEVPDVKVYRIEELDDAPFVTFHHKEHVELFGLDCVDCHREETCTRCHEVGPRPKHERKEPHEDCNSCHLQRPSDSHCDHCHADAQRPGFNHAERSGFDTSIYHKRVTCQECHDVENNIFTGLETKCRSCHAADWEPKPGFDHAITGVALDEMHAEFACQDCHPKGMGRPGQCDACHDDGRRSFPRK